MIFRIIRTALVTIAVLFALLIGSTFWIEYSGRITHERLRSLVISAYYASAARGEVAQPAPEPGSVRAIARCSLSSPSIVHVKTSSGEERTYHAEGHPSFTLKAESWTFKPMEQRRHEPR